MIPRHSVWLLLFILLFSCSSPPLPIEDQPLITEPQAVLPFATTVHPPTRTSSSMPLPFLTATSTASPKPTVFSLTPTATLPPPVTANCLSKSSPAEHGIVTQVIDGDTVYVRMEDGKEYNLRYIGVDSPEKGQIYFEEAMKTNSDLVLNKEVALIKDVSEVDQYNRMLRYVVVGNLFVNQEMLRSGYATAVRYPPDIACADTFESVETGARAAGVGMWVPKPTPQPSDAQVVIIEVNKVAEWVSIQNNGTSDVDLKGWRLVSERGNQECNLQGVIKAGEILRIWAMTAQGDGYSCGFASNIWNNSQPDPAVLYNPQSIEVSRK